MRPIAEENEVNFYYPDSKTVVISVNETTTIEDVNQIISIFAKATHQNAFEIETLTEGNAIPQTVIRKTEFLTHDVFNSFQSETEMMRYIKNWSVKICHSTTR